VIHGSVGALVETGRQSCRQAAYALFSAVFYRRISTFLYKMFLHLQDIYGIIFQHSTQLWMPGRCPHGLAGERKKLEVTN